MSNDYTPFFARRGDHLSPEGAMHFGETTRLVELPVSWSLDDYPHFEYHRNASGSVLPGLRPADDVFRNWTDDIVYMLRDFDDGIAVVTFHPQVIGRGHRFVQQLYYGKIIAGQPSFLAPDYLPDFISALVGRGLEQERDVTRLYFDGRLSGEARAIYEWLLDHPAQPTRHQAGRSSEEAGN